MSTPSTSEKPSSPYVVVADDINQATGPLFINKQTSPVGVYTPNRKKLYVLPYSDRTAADTDHPSKNPDRVFCVRGDHYANYAQHGGQLTVFLLPDKKSASGSDAAGTAVRPPPRHASMEATGSTAAGRTGAPSAPAAGGAGGAAGAAGQTGAPNGGAAGGGSQASGESDSKPPATDPNASTGTSVRRIGGRTIPRPRA